MKRIALAGTALTVLVLTAPGAQADGLDGVSEFLPHIVPAHHTHRILVCDGDDDDDGGRCYYVRVPRGYYGYHYEGRHWRHRRGYDDDDDDGGRRYYRRGYSRDDNDDDDD